MCIRDSETTARSTGAAENQSFCGESGEIRRAFAPNRNYYRRRLVGSSTENEVKNELVTRVVLYACVWRCRNTSQCCLQIANSITVACSRIHKVNTEIFSVSQTPEPPNLVAAAEFWALAELHSSKPNCRRRLSRRIIIGVFGFISTCIQQNCAKYISKRIYDVHT